jgi:ribosomal-protein-alanine N-acetyltransferase
MLPIDLPQDYPFADQELPFVIEAMRPSDIDGIMPIECNAFPSPWPASAYRYELKKNRLSTYLVMRWRDPVPSGPSSIVAYGGFWIILDEGHISTLAVHPDWRGRTLGQTMLVALIDAAALAGASEATLEVRVSNVVAQALYRKYGFRQVGVRKRYYRDNNEDALIMTTPTMGTDPFQREYARLKSQLRERQLAVWNEIV